MNFINNKVFDDFLNKCYDEDEQRNFDISGAWDMYDYQKLDLYEKLIKYFVLQKYISKEFYKKELKKFDKREMIISDSRLTPNQTKFLSIDICEFLQYYILLRDNDSPKIEISSTTQLREYISNNY